MKKITISISKELQRLHEILTLCHLVNEKTEFAVCFDYAGYNYRTNVMIKKGKNFGFDGKEDDLKNVINKKISLKSNGKFPYYDSQYYKENIKICKKIVSILELILENAKILDRDAIIEKLKNTFPDDIHADVL